MITRTFAAPIGSGLRQKVVAPAAIDTGRRITVIVPSMVVFECNWSKRLPNACGITPIAWLRRAEDFADDLIIVDCINASMMVRIVATLQSVPAEVWVVGNGDEDLAPLAPTGVSITVENPNDLAPMLLVTMNTDTTVLTEGITQPDVAGFINGDSGVIPFDAEAWAHPPVAKPRPSSIVSISQSELDQLLAPYIGAGLLRTIYTAATHATEYRGPSGKVIAISLRGNHYRNRDTVLGSTPRNLPAHMLPTRDMIRASNVGAGKTVTILRGTV